MDVIIMLMIMMGSLTSNMLKSTLRACMHAAYVHCTARDK